MRRSSALFFFFLTVLPGCAPAKEREVSQARPPTSSSSSSSKPSPPEPPPSSSKGGSPQLPPALDHDDFWKHQALVVTRPVTGLLQVAFVRVLAEKTFEVHPEPMREYHALPLGAFLEARAKQQQPASGASGASGVDIGQGDHLTITNLRGEQLYMTRADIAKHAPVIVIGVDGDRNLFRFFTPYQLKQQYSWRAPTPREGAAQAGAAGAGSGAPPPMIRPVGPFLFFPNGEPPELEDTTNAAFCLTPSSFRFTKDDPLAAVRSLSPEVRQALLGRDGCLKCHSFRGAGARAHHVRLNDGQTHGGFALPFEEYPRDVFRRFLFDQDAVAASFGVEPLHVDSATAKLLYDLTEPKKK